MSHAFELTVVASGSATHPAGVLLDEDGHPVLDESGEPVMKGDES